MVRTGEQQPRMRTRHIVHPAQTQQDALNDFAGNLVNPPEPYIGHIRMPQEYHQTKLHGPVSVDPDPVQIDQIRSQSRDLYRINPDEDDEGGTASAPAPTPPPQGPPPPLPRIGRRPRPRTDPAQGSLPIDKDE
jgi:hypothetical protein